MNGKSTLLCWDYRHFGESHFAADLRTIFKYSWVLRDTSQLPSLILLSCCHWWQRWQPLNETNRHRLYTVKVPVDQVSRISSGWLACDDSVSSVFVVLARRGAAVGPKKVCAQPLWRTGCCFMLLWLVSGKHWLFNARLGQESLFFFPPKSSPVSI